MKGLAVLPLLACLLPAAPARAEVMSGADYSLESSLVGVAGKSVAVGADYEAIQAIGDAALALASNTGSPDATYVLLSGYLSGVRPGSLIGGPVVEAFLAPTAIVTSGFPIGVPADGALRVVFSNDMLAGTIQTSAFEVVAQWDSQMTPVSVPQPFTVAYDDLQRAAVITPSGGWLPGARIGVLVKTDVADFDTLPLGSPKQLEFEALRPNAPDHVVSAPWDTSIRISLPASAFTQPFAVLVSSKSAPEVPTRKVGAALHRSPVQVLDFTAKASGGATLPAAFASPAKLTVTYPDADADGVMDGTPYRARTLSLWRLDEKLEMWVRLPGGETDPASRSVSAPLRSFSTYALIGGLDTFVDAVIAFPVPFRPNAGDAARYGTWTDGIRFANLPDQGHIRIYDASGQKVRQLPLTGALTVKWDVRNETGDIVGSGVYIWEVVSGGNRKTGKLMVVK